MNIRRIRTKNFIGHKDVTIELPRSGIVLLYGDNGSGKSSAIEAVSVGLWNKTLRGISLTDQRNSFIELMIDDDFVVQRERKGNKTSLRFGCGSLKEYNTASKGQTDLESIVGTFDSWRWSSVLSSQDSLSFAMSTDAERKRLIESILGLYVFDEALEQCRADVHATHRSYETINRNLDVLKERLAGLHARLRDSRVSLPEQPILGDAHQTLSEAILRERKVQTKLRELQDQIISHKSSARSNDLTLRQLEGELKQMKAVNVCPTCFRNVDAHTRMSLEARVLGKIGEAGKVLSEDQEALARKQRVIEDLREGITLIRAEITEARQRIAEYVRWEEMAQRQGVHSDVLKKEALTCEGDILDIEDKLGAIEMDARELDAVSNVLGLRGARNLVIADALGGLEAVANVWLSRIFPKASLVISGVKQLKSGGSVNKIDIQIDGVGHGKGYNGCSGGERRRIDVALLIALNEIRSHSYGLKPTSLFFDEAMYVLDSVGLESVSNVLTEISQDRCVFVITHKPEFIEFLSPEVTYHMVDGECHET
jgi:DNA repair exonuclease SbcCD ATPase subunit